MNFILSIALLIYPPNQEGHLIRQHEQVTDRAAFGCSQPAAERDSLLREAVESQYWVRRVEFAGIEHTRDDVLRRRILLVEGDIFTRENLVKSLERLSRLQKIIYPVRLSDVIIRLNREEKVIDMAICFREKGRSHPRGRRGSGKRAS